MKPGEESRPSKRATRSRGDNKQLVEYTEKLKAAYIRERRFYDAQISGRPSHYQPSKRLDGRESLSPEHPVLPNVWQRVAAALLADGIDPVDYVQKVFAVRIGRTFHPPMAKDLLRADVHKDYEEARILFCQSVRQSLQRENGIATAKILSYQECLGYSMIRATWVTLCDGMLALSPLYRHCLAMSMKKKRFTSLAKESFEDAAVVQFMRAREEYLKFWAPILPSGFDERARRRYAMDSDV